MPAQPQQTVVSLLRIPVASFTLAASMAAGGCAAPIQPEFTFQQAQVNRDNIERIEAMARAQRREERMSQAEAEEVASRHNPSSISTTTVYAPRF